MPVENAKITFYKVTECGYYPRSEEAPIFGSTAEMLVDLQKWVAGKLLADTKTYEAADGADHLPVYLMDIQSDQASCVLTMWNETPATDGNVAAAIGTSAVGQAKVVMNKLPVGSIPGFATYFWFIPDQNLFASIRFQHLVTGQKPMQTYMESFLDGFSKHVVYTDPDENQDISLAGYRADATAEIHENLYPRFRTQLLRKAGQHDFIVKHADQIVKVQRKTSLKLDRPESLAKWQSMLAWIGMREKPNRPDQVRVNYEMSASLNAEDVQKIIDEWNENHAREWDDYGFTFKGEKSPRWLSHSLARDEFDLDIERNDLEVVNAQSLLKALNGSRVQILNLLK